MKRLFVLGIAGFALCLHLDAAEPPQFGFAGPEIFPIENMIGQLHVADLDGDKLQDIIVANNARSRITILYNQTGRTNQVRKVAAEGRRDINELPADARFQIDSITSEKRISSLVVADLNADGKPDIAYYGDPKELIVIYNEGARKWSPAKRWAIEDGQLSPNALASGDLNGDGRVDLVLLADNHVYVLFQGEDKTLSEPTKIPLSGIVKSVQVVDIDGDGRSDLLLVNWEDRNPFRFRRQTADGQLGPEIYFSQPPIRSYWADNLEPGGKTQVITIAQNSGRAQIAEFVRKPAEPLSRNYSQGQLEVVPLNRTEKARRGVLWADLNGDGLADLVVAEPESGQISVQFQEKGGWLASPRAFPTLAGVSDLAAADWEGDGKPELFLLSADERQIGVARLDENKRLPFPTLVPMEGRPLVMAVGKLSPESKPTLAVVVDKEGKRSLVTRGAEGKWQSQQLKEDFRSNPTTIEFHDVDQDGLTDLVILTPYEKVKVLRQVAGKPFEEIDIAPPGGALEQPWLARADIDGDGKPELLLTQKNFLRAIVMKRNRPGEDIAPGDWSFQVKEQINGVSSSSRLAGAAALTRGTNGLPSLLLLDVERKALSFCERSTSAVWQVVKTLPLPISDFSALEPIALGGQDVNAVSLIGLNAIAVMRLMGDRWVLEELDGYETPIKDGRLSDVVSGDLDNDGRKDLVFLETARNYLDLVVFSRDHKLVPANRWQVFEERTFRGRAGSLPEPREAAVADVTGDGKNDLIVVVHDRILVYPQD